MFVGKTGRSCGSDGWICSSSRETKTENIQRLVPMSLCVHERFSYNHKTVDNGSCVEVNIPVLGQGSAHNYYSHYR